MLRFFVVWAGAFAGACAANVASQMLSNISGDAIPGLILFATFAAFVPATLMPTGFACGFLLRRRRPRLGIIFLLSLVLAAVDVVAPYLMAEWSPSSRGNGPAFGWAPFVGGVIMVFAPAADARDDATRPRSASSFERARRGLAIVEGALLVFPLVALWPLGLVAFVIENHARIRDLSIGLVVMAISAAALAAVLHLLMTFLGSRAAALRLFGRSWWACAAGGAALAVLGSVIALLEWSGTIGRGLQTPLGIGFFGLPALLPLLHMVIEARTTASGTPDGTRGA